VRTIINFVIGLLVMAGTFLVDAPKWAAIGTSVIVFYIYCAADFVVEQIKSEGAK